MTADASAGPPAGRPPVQRSPPGPGPLPATPGLLRIADAARAVGVSPSALRLWERQGLVTPVRAGRERRYGPDDLTRLRDIRRLRAVDGLNAAGIRRALGEPAAAGDRPSAASPVTVAAGAESLPAGRGPAPGNGPGRDPGRGAGRDPGNGHDDPAAVGARLRSLRATAGLSLRELGERTGLSASFLSGLERGTTGASLAALVRLAAAHGTTLAVIVGASDGATAGGAGSSRRAAERVVRGEARPTLAAGRGIRIEDLAIGSSQLQPQLFVLAPGATSAGAYDHAGEEFLFVLAGRLVVWLDERECHELAPGDALTFASSIPHRFVALGRDETRVLWVNTPPTF